MARRHPLRRRGTPTDTGPADPRYLSGARTYNRRVPRLPSLSESLFAARAVPRIVATAWRLSRLARRHRLIDLPERMRAVPEPDLRFPAWWDAVLIRLLPALPPYRFGRCLKRSLILLDLWSRCGLQPRLHLGVRRPGDDPLEGHAWVTTGDPRLDRRTGPEGWEEMWSG